MADRVHRGAGASRRPDAGPGVAVAALACGVGGILLFWTILGGVLLGLLAVVLGFVASRLARRRLATGHGLAVTAVVLGVVGTLLSVLVIGNLGGVGR